MKPVCYFCNVAFVMIKVGVTLAEMFQNGKKVYRIWSADLLECPGCRHKVVYGRGDNALGYHYDRDLDAEVAALKSQGKTVVKQYEKLEHRPV